MARNRPTLQDVQRCFGGKIQRRGDDVYLQMCTPNHSVRDRGTTVRIRSDGRGVVAHSWNASSLDTRDEIHRAIGFDPRNVKPLSKAEQRKQAAMRMKEQAAQDARRLQQVARMVDRSDAPANMRRYLIGARGLPVATVALACASGALRDHTDEQGRGSGLALAHDSKGDLRACQMTKLRSDGSGKRGDPARLTFGPYKGSACKLFVLTDDVLAVAEGVETALAFYSLRKIPTWATFGTVNLAAFEPPAKVRKLFIAADGDAPGEEAAQTLSDRLKRRVRCIIVPAPKGRDWLDVLNLGGAS